MSHPNCHLKNCDEPKLDTGIWCETHASPPSLSHIDAGLVDLLSSIEGCQHMMDIREVLSHQYRIHNFPFELDSDDEDATPLSDLIDANRYGDGDES